MNEKNNNIKDNKLEFNTYCIFEKEKGSKLNASFYDKKTKEFGFVTNKKELKILNEIIRKLNRKYIRRRD